MLGVSVLVLVLLMVVGGWSWPSSLPFWPHYPSRSVQVLDGSWSFQFVSGLDIDQFDPSQFTPTQNISVPLAFDVAQPGVVGLRGTGIYGTEITVNPSNPLLLYFSSCAFYCKIWVDGHYIGDHRAGGYQPFWLQAPASDLSTRQLLVLADNRWNRTTAPTYTGGDFYFYSGLLRSVVVHEQPGEVFLWQVETFPVNVEKGLVDIRIVFGGPAITSAVLSFGWDGSTPSPPTSYPVSGNVVLIFSAGVPNPKPWNIGSPNLHTLLVSYHSASHIVDSIEVRFGLRLLSVTKDARLAINGQVQKLVGVNRHTMWPSTGAGIRLDQLETDIQLLLDLGANYVRGAHYPQDERFLDLCDEKGIVVWEEALGPGVKVADIQDPVFMKYQEQSLNEMISASINHPSVIFHGFFNEGPSNNKLACSGYKKCGDVIRSRVGNPPSRLVTWASNQGENDVCFEYADVISFNSYPAWYSHPGNISYIVPFWQSQVDWITKTNPSKPFFISETGAGGIFEWVNTSNVFWSQNFQAAVIQADAMFAVQSPRISGITIWQFSDIKIGDDETKACGSCLYKQHPPSLETPWDCESISTSCGRPGGENHKGVVDFWRRKKMAFDTLQLIYKNSKQFV